MNQPANDNRTLAAQARALFAPPAENEEPWLADLRRVLAEHVEEANRRDKCIQILK